MPCPAVRFGLFCRQRTDARVDLLQPALMEAQRQSFAAGGKAYGPSGTCDAGAGRRCNSAVCGPRAGSQAWPTSKKFAAQVRGVAASRPGRNTPCSTSFGQ